MATGAAHGLTIERVRGLKLSSQVKYSTVQSSESITFGKLTFEPAIASVHFTSVTEANVIFNIDVVSVSICSFANIYLLLSFVHLLLSFVHLLLPSVHSFLHSIGQCYHTYNYHYN